MSKQERQRQKLADQTQKAKLHAYELRLKAEGLLDLAGGSAGARAKQRCSTCHRVKDGTGPNHKDCLKEGRICEGLQFCGFTRGTARPVPDSLRS